MDYEDAITSSGEIGSLNNSLKDFQAFLRLQKGSERSHRMYVHIQLFSERSETVL